MHGYHFIGNGRETDLIVSMHVEEGGYPRKIHTNGKEIPKSVTTTEASLSYQLLGSLDTGKNSIESPECAEAEEQ